MFFFFFWSGCYGFWCCPCLACTVAGNFGQNRCLPLCDICSPSVMSAFGIPLFVPPAGLALRVGVRHKYNIKVKHLNNLLMFEQLLRKTESPHAVLYKTTCGTTFFYLFLQGSICKDIATSCICVWCNWCQMHRELKYRKKGPAVVNMQPSK